jgi:hypothetical protein
MPTEVEGRILIEINSQVYNTEPVTQNIHYSILFEIKYTVNFTYSEHGYRELPVIGNNLFWPEFYPSLFNINKYGYSEHGYKELSLIRNSFLSPNLVKSTENYTFITNSKILAIRK